MTAPYEMNRRTFIKTTAATATAAVAPSALAQDAPADGLIHRNARLFQNLAGYKRIVVRHNAAGVDNAEFLAAILGFAVNPVAASIWNVPVSPLRYGPCHPSRVTGLYNVAPAGAP